MENYIHPSQYANKGKPIWELNCVIRDIFNEMQNENPVDSFMVRIDFRKAFDCISFNYLYKVMEKMGLPSKFIAMVKSTDTNISSKIIINGGKSQRVQVKRGTRQGDPLSMDKFIIALNPLLNVLHQCNRIQKYVSMSNKNFLTLANADDLTVVTNSLTSLLHIKNIIENFAGISGLNINIDKTIGFFFNKLNVHRIQDLPYTHWNNNAIILGIPYGSESFIELFWKEKFQEFDQEIKFYKSFSYLTLQAKAIISKSKLLPKMSYVSSTLIMPNHIKSKIEDRMVKFIVPHGKTFLTIKELSARRDMGGIDLANIVLHCNIMLVRNVIQYIKTKKANTLLRPEHYFIEYNLGHQLSSLYNLRIDNRTSHAFRPNAFYSYVLDILKYFKNLGLEDDDFLNGKVNVIYKIVLEKLNVYNFTMKWRLLHVKFLPNYLLSFNYRVHFDLLPVKAKFMMYALDNDSRCRFCNLGYESSVHIFAKCLKLGVVWDFFNEVMALLNINFDFFVKRRLWVQFDVMSLSCTNRDSFKLLLYLYTVINYHIWKLRNQCVHQSVSFDHKTLVSNIIRSIGSRRNWQRHAPTEQYLIPRIDEVYNAMITIRNITFHLDTG